MTAEDHGAHGSHGRRRRTWGGRGGAHGPVASIGGATFVLTTKEDALAVTTGPDTNDHTPGVAKEARRAGYNGYHDLAFAALPVGRRRGAVGEPRATPRCTPGGSHIPKP